MTKNELRRHISLVREKEELELKIEMIETELYAPKKQFLTDMPKGTEDGNKEEQRRVGKVDALNDLRDYYENLIEEIEQEILKIETAIRPLPPTERMLMRHRYVEGRPWEDICVLMGYSWRSIHRIHASALAKVQQGNNEAD